MCRPFFTGFHFLYGSRWKLPTFTHVYMYILTYSPRVGIHIELYRSDLLYRYIHNFFDLTYSPQVGLHLSVHLFSHLFVSLSVHLFSHLFVFMYVYIYIYIDMCVCVDSNL